MVYKVAVVRTGFVYVEAEDKAAAMWLADHLTTDEVNWSEDWGPTYAVEANDYCGTVFTEPSF